MTMGKKGWLLAAALIFMTVLTACGGGTPANQADTPAAEASQNALERIKASGKLRLATSADFPPFEFHSIIDGKDTIIGSDIAIAKEIAADLGVELVITDMGFDGLLTALQSGNVDIVLAGMTADAERAQSVDFSTTYYTSVQKVVVRGADKEKYKAVADLAGQKVGAQLGSIQEGVVTDQMAESEVRALTKIPDLILDLKSGNVEAVVLDAPVAEAYVKANPELVIADVQLQQDEDGFAAAMPKNSPELVEAVNATIQRLIDSGKMEEFVTEATNAM